MAYALPRKGRRKHLGIPRKRKPSVTISRAKYNGLWCYPGIGTTGESVRCIGSFPWGACFAFSPLGLPAERGNVLTDRFSFGFVQDVFTLRLLE